MRVRRRGSGCCPASSNPALAAGSRSDPSRAALLLPLSCLLHSSTDSSWRWQCPRVGQCKNHFSEHHRVCLRPHHVSGRNRHHYREAALEESCALDSAGGWISDLILFNFECRRTDERRFFRILASLPTQAAGCIEAGPREKQGSRCWGLTVLIRNRLLAESWHYLKRRCYSRSAVMELTNLFSSAFGTGASSTPPRSAR